MLHFHLLTRPSRFEIDVYATPWGKYADDIKDREPHDDFDRGEEEGGGAGAGGFEDDEVSVAESAQAADMRELAAVEPQMAANRKGYLVCWGNNQYNQLGPALDNQAQVPLRACVLERTCSRAHAGQCVGML